ncbi:hypothetical protein [Clostridium estertheticum]|uniref:hypothetical protein n=1 Tax=Clostridium estertheticum TaxID=238834 RepID=UPI001C0E8D03|nr:hypothetical protein [Clostridium estertheticum]MBU3186565.1 hypothetical protein [Clostridium estertheticum]
MTNETLDKAYELKENIRNVDMFLHQLKYVQRLKITSRVTKILLNNIAYGAFDGNSFKCDKKLTDKIITLLEGHKVELEKEYKELI